MKERQVFAMEWNFKVSTEMLETGGFHFYMEKRNTIYYVNSNTEKVVADVIRSNVGRRFVATTVELCEASGWKDISLSKGNVQNPLPSAGGALHRYIEGRQKGMVVDHINHCYLYCVPENLRVCTHIENGGNSRPTVRKVSEKGGYYSYKIQLKNNMGNREVDILKKHNFIVPEVTSVGCKDICRKNPGFFEVVNLERQENPLLASYMCSPVFKTPEEAYRNMRVVNEALYGEYTYCMENDFAYIGGIDYLIGYYFLNLFSEKELFEYNRKHWRAYWDWMQYPEKAAYMK